MNKRTYVDSTYLMISIVFIIIVVVGMVLFIQKTTPPTDTWDVLSSNVNTNNTKISVNNNNNSINISVNNNSINISVKEWS